VVEGAEDEVRLGVLDQRVPLELAAGLVGPSYGHSGQHGVDQAEPAPDLSGEPSQHAALLRRRDAVLEADEQLTGDERSSGRRLAVVPGESGRRRDQH
jgi:hypothetical protein